MRTLIKNGHIIDPARHMSYKADILVENGIISGIIQVKAFDVPVSDIAVDEVIDAEGLVVAPGLIDTHVHFRDPGFTYKEDINENIEKAFIEYYQSGSTVDTIDEVLTRYYRNDTLIMTVFLSMIILIPVFIIAMIIKNKIENKKNTEN